MAITLDATSSKGGTGVSSITNNHTIAGENRMLLVWTSRARGDVAGTISSVTFNGVALTLKDSDSQPDANGHPCKVQLWYMASPPVGTFSIVATSNISTGDLAYVAISYNGSDGTVGACTKPPGRAGSFTSVSMLHNSATGWLIVDGLAQQDGNTFVAGASQTLEDEDVGGTVNIEVSDAPGAASVTMSWSWNTAGAYAYIVTNLFPGVQTQGGIWIVSD